MAMLKIIRRRALQGKETNFELRGEPVNLDNIVRFEKRAIKKGKLADEDTLSDIG
jgi:hypothetical protein